MIGGQVIRAVRSNRLSLTMGGRLALMLSGLTLTPEALRTSNYFVVGETRRTGSYKTYYDNYTAGKIQKKIIPKAVLVNSGQSLISTFCRYIIYKVKISNASSLNIFLVKTC